MANLSQPLNPLRLPLQGERLIEASAGTGKTFTLGLLYLRLLLGLGGETAFERPLQVEEILVVTFTEAATAELRGRIRDNIHQLRIACIRHLDNPDYTAALAKKNPPLAALLAEIADPSVAARQLLLAERQMDAAAVYTIHGFCQRMLNLNAFESGVLFEQQLLEDEQGVLRQASEDFWRRYCYPLERSLAAEIVKNFASPQHLLSCLQPWLQGELPAFQPLFNRELTLNDLHQQNLAKIDQLKRLWCQAADDLLPLIQDSDVDKRSYNSKHLPTWHRVVSEWAVTVTESYAYPEKELSKFSQSQLSEKTRRGTAPKHPVFDAVESFLTAPPSLYAHLVGLALTEIRRGVQQEKQQQALLSFDDLLSRLDNALQQPTGDTLATLIRQRYPVAMIDEFQDTDPLQYRIFKQIYHQQPGVAMLLIGDPKQAIYAFRGADIFTYIQARQEVTAHYSLETNWRSSPEMVTAVNRLFTAHTPPFLFEQIPFQPVKSASHHHGMTLWRDNQAQPAMRIWLQPGDGSNKQQYQQKMAKYCAADIAAWLVAGQNSDAYFTRGDTQLSVTAADITVLVRSRSEASLIREALLARGIASVYLSSRDSVYQTAEARELLWLLQAILAPAQQRLLRTALATTLMGFDAATLEATSQNSQEWDQLTDQFANWQQQWRRFGLLPMLRNLMQKQQLAENILCSERGERRLTDIMHLAELLQAASVDLDSPHALVRYLAQQIEQPDINASSQQLRLESDRNLVTIVTIHKSKGLEYPLVWIPFIASYRETKTALYHDRNSYALRLDLEQADQTLALAEQERLAEDLRLLYVAMTRAIWHCSIGIGPIFLTKRNYHGTTELHHSAIGYLLQQGQPLEAEQLATVLREFSGKGIELVEKPVMNSISFAAKDPRKQNLANAEFHRQLTDQWRVTSYSGLQQHGNKLAQLLPGFDIDAASDSGQDTSEQFTAHQFPKGAGPGTFLHHLFERCEFTSVVDTNWVAEQLIQWGFDPVWQMPLTQWLTQVLSIPLPVSAVSLSQLASQDRLVEMEFYLPIEQPLSAQLMDKWVKDYDPLSRQAPALDFRQVQGMLKGFIDLVFRWEGKYYLLDYKSNWLGSDAQAYTQQAIAQAMIEHRYDLQYQLYSLALHRYLKLRLADYDYAQHFGGVYYLFLRGMAEGQAGQGVFYHRPDQALIEGLDRLFSGKEQHNE